MGTNFNSSQDTDIMKTSFTTTKRVPRYSSLRQLKTYLKNLFSPKKSKHVSTRELTKEDEFAKNKLKIFIGTWNMHGKLPPYELAPFLEAPRCIKKSTACKRPYLDRLPHHPYHLIVIGTQECQHNINHSVFFPSKEEWESRLKDYLGHHYVLVKAETLAGLHLAVFVWVECKYWVQRYQHASIPTGIANLFANKGAVGISLLFGNTSLLFINSHLAAHQSKLKQRSHDVKKITKELKLKGFFPTDKAFNYVTDRFDYAFWFGDMNYRVDMSRQEANILLDRGDFASLLSRDQLSKELLKNPILANFHEAPITFPPTFKFDITYHSDEYRHRRPRITQSYSAPSFCTPKICTPPYDTSEKQRVPSWTDRIIYKTRVPKTNAVIVQNYTGHMNVIGFSDHKPVTGCFLVEHDWDSHPKASEICPIPEVRASDVHKSEESLDFTKSTIEPPS
ncbi:hypothetical protein G9A89_006156 [Geosiphon pyriformis]|nr:hypothetical protein G9A89_006156 [Geosiphon pyriformis]